MKSTWPCQNQQENAVGATKQITPRRRFEQYTQITKWK